MEIAPHLIIISLSTLVHFSIKIFRPGYSQKAKEKAKLAAGNMIIGSLRGEVDHTPSSNVSVLNGLHINNHNTTGNNRAPSFTGSHCSTSTKHHMEDVKEIVHVTQLHQLVPATPLPSMAQQPNQTKLSRSNSSHH